MLARRRTPLYTSRMTSDAWATLPNLLSLSRLALAAVFVSVPAPEVRLWLVALAGATDFLDGWLARHWGTSTRWGALLDPIADRFFVMIAVLALLFDGSVTTLQYFILISRDLVTMGGFLIAQAVPRLRHFTFQARWSGKLVTVLQLATLAIVFLAPERLAVAVIAVGLASAVSIVDYIAALARGRAAA